MASLANVRQLRLGLVFVPCSLACPVQAPSPFPQTPSQWMGLTDKRNDKSGGTLQLKAFNFPLTTLNGKLLSPISK